MIPEACRIKREDQVEYYALVKIRVYTDTSVLGGCEDEEFAELSDE